MNFSFIFFPRSFTISLFNLICPTTSFISKKSDVTFTQLKRNCFWALKELDFLQCWQNQDAVWEKITFTRPVEPREWRKYVYLLVERLVVAVGWPTTSLLDTITNFSGGSFGAIMVGGSCFEGANQTSRSQQSRKAELHL